jgi:hypothetical protein
MITCYHDNRNNILQIKKYLLSTGDAVTDTIDQACTVSKEPGTDPLLFSNAFPQWHSSLVETVQ